MESTAPSHSVDTTTRPSSVRSSAPLASHEPRWIRGLAATLEARGTPPEFLVYASLVAGLFAAFFLPVGTLVESGVGTAALVLAAIAIQLRVVFDLVADRMFGPAPTKHPPFIASVPDLALDAAMVVAAGYAASGVAAGPILGWTAALLGLMLAHVRTLNIARRVLPAWAGLARPMIRMVALTATCVVAAILPYGWRQVAFLLALTGMGAACGAAIWARIAPRAIL
jgi:hypothetical protein